MGKMTGKLPPKKEASGSLDFLNEHANEGFEGLDSRDYVIPFLRILQRMSPQCDEDSAEKLTGAMPGLFFNTVNRKIYGKSVQVIPISFKKLWLEWLPKRMGLVNRYEPYSIKVDTSDFSHWRIKERPENIIQETYSFFCLLIGHIDDGPLIFSLSSSGLRHGKNWNTQLMMTRLPNGKRAPFYSSVWKLETVINKNKDGSWYQIGAKKTAINRVRFITPKEFSEHVLPIRDSIKESLVNADYSQITDESSATSGEEKQPY